MSALIYLDIKSIVSSIFGLNVKLLSYRFEIFLKTTTEHLANARNGHLSCYLAGTDVLVFEDLRSQGFDLCQEFSFNEQLIRSALSTLAPFHTSAIIADKRLGQSLEKAFSNASKKITRLSIDTLVLIAKRFNVDIALVTKIANCAHEMAKTNTTGFNVIFHGDLWKNNLIFDDAQSPNCILIDYQLLRYHSPITDICMLLYLNAIPQFPRQSEMYLLKHYYSVLRSVIDENDCKLNIPTYDSIMKDYQKYRLVGILT
ncbi:PREDICTED: uncharacterized protein LOC105366318 [Ceratosolen solmsi marchali]|uniref:Uncharacterized protein LOC105366318 n=1 Tax=Ceratosolen solmsi marchali TaxID=326594 RepID=A0AAJ7E0C6_9HYME|nr:PREDICTED: uncharacterized protein LOC105366318 [Ceratosolen solmsi marchali]